MNCAGIGVNMKIDMHCHTREGSIDAKVGIEDYIRKLISLGYDGMLITDHNSYRGYGKWTELVNNIKISQPFKVFKGIEYDTRDAGHIIAILPEHINSKLLEIRGMTVEQLEKIVHNMGGVLGPAHPYGTGFFAFMNTRFGKKHQEFIDKFDFVETFNACTKPFANFKARKLATEHSKLHIAGSDAHKENIIGSAFTIFEHAIENNDDLIKIIKENAKTIADGTVLESMKRRKSIILEKIGVAGYWVYNKAGAWIRKKRLESELNQIKIN